MYTIDTTWHLIPRKILPGPSSWPCPHRNRLIASSLHIFSHLLLNTGTTNHPITTLHNESTIPSPLLGLNPTMFVNKRLAANESSQIIKSPRSTRATIPWATFSEDGNFSSSCAKVATLVPWIRFVRSGLVSCSRTNPGEMKSAGKAMWIV